MTERRPINMIKAINLALHDAMAENDQLLMLGEDLADGEGGGVFGVTKGLSTAYGDDRVRSTPISEQAIIGAAIGAALTGQPVVAELMLMNFTTVAMDMIVNHAAKLRYMSGGQTGVPIVIRTATGSGFGNGGQHSDYLEAWFAHTPGLKVVAPSNPADAYGLMRAAIEDPDPVIFIENIALYFKRGPEPERGSRIALGTARVVREGDALTIVTHSRMTLESLAAAEVLAAEGIAVEVIDLMGIAPWDRGTVLASVRKTGRVLVVHEAVREHGIGGEIVAFLAEQLGGGLRAIRRLGGAFTPVPFSKPLETAFSPGSAGIVETARAMASGR